MIVIMFVLCFLFIEENGIFATDTKRKNISVYIVNSSINNFIVRQERTSSNRLSCVHYISLSVLPNPGYVR